MLYTKEIARMLLDAERDGKKSIELTHGNSKCTLLLTKAYGIIKDAVHYSKKLWQAEIDSLGIMNVCEQRPHKAVIEFGKMTNAIVTNSEGASKAISKMICKSLRLHSSTKDYQAAAAKPKVAIKAKVAKTAKTLKAVKSIEVKAKKTKKAKESPVVASPVINTTANEAAV